MANSPSDRFDEVPENLLRTGAHRAPARAGRGWIKFAWAALFTGILVAVGLFGLAVVGGSVVLPFNEASGTSSSTATPSVTPDASATPSSTPTPTATPTPTSAINPALSITVLNGTRTAGLAALVGDNLVKLGWTGASATLGARGNVTAGVPVRSTVVYYNSAANAGAARAMLASLKVGTAQLSTQYPKSPLTIVVGTDYVAPAK